MKSLKMLGFILVVAAVLVAGCTTSETPEATPTPTQTPAMKNIVETAQDAGSFTTLLAGIQAAGLTETLSGEGPFTVFAPTDDAMAALPEGTIAALLEDPEGDLKDILLYHVVSGNLMAADVTSQPDAMTLNGKRIQFDTTGGVMVEEANIITTDIVCSNGVIHVIDAVMLPKDNIVETAVADGRFTTLVAALQAAGLDTTLSDETMDFTVFAPTDDAFAALPEGTVEALLEDPSGQLTDILLYHVADGRYMAADITTMSEIDTLQGSPLAIDTSDGVMVDGANVIITDVKCSNGVIHVIDAVMIPPEA
ncbi:fasciclin domain-containing protein [Methanogenium marinum]|uniref:Fasciclin domain-containing protein n=1 Tax=Methanogenium marinum TaxID=348610 RepID=A0A9Q4KV59_9EURY|nr:fasciclin domain-containing protein [Methanogenium marinum]MDE4908782.1 fasciclin domain-containing protein [Methanogenium marinum]